MTLLDEDAERWYCFHDDEIYYAKEKRWVSKNAGVDTLTEVEQTNT